MQTHHPLLLAALLALLALLMLGACPARPSEQTRVIVLEPGWQEARRSRTLLATDRFRKIYDGYHARTYFMLGRPDEPLSSTPRLHLFAAHEGRQPDQAITELSVSLRASAGPTHRLRDCHALELLADGRVLPLRTKPVYVADRMPEGERYEQVSSSISLDMLARLAAARTRSARLCASFQIPLDKERGALRAMVAALRAVELR